MTTDREGSTVRLRRSASLVVPALLLPALVACGSTKTGYGDATTEGFSGVTISGEPGKAPTVKWHKEIAYPTSTTVKTLVKGTGAAVAKGDSISAYIWLGDGTTKLDAYSDYANGSPETLTYDSDMGAEWAKILKGAHYGDRVAAVVASDKLLGEAGNASLGIGTKDSLLVIVDLVEKTTPSPSASASASASADATPALKGPKGKVQAAPSWMPTLKLKGGATSDPTGMDFSKVKKPKTNGKLKKAILIKGSGKKVKATDTITANYYGMVYGAKTPFDQSYDGDAFTSALSGLVKGWQEGLVGVPVGSRVFLQIPPSLGYGDTASGDIPANSTLYFVLDILAAN